MSKWISNCISCNERWSEESLDADGICPNCYDIHTVLTKQAEKIKELEYEIIRLLDKLNLANWRIHELEKKE